MRIFQSFNKTVTVSMILIASLAVSVVGSIWITREYVKFNGEIKVLKKQYIDQQKEMVRSEVDRAIKFIEYKKARTNEDLKASLRQRVYEAVAVVQGMYDEYTGKVDPAEIKIRIREALRPLRFNQGRGYFFIYDMEGNNILLPTAPELEGKNLLDLRDSKGQYTIRRATQLVSTSGEGFLDWSWYRPEETEVMREKVGFVKEFKPFNWMVGTGEYLEDFTYQAQQETLEWVNKIRYGKDGYIFVYDFKATTLAHFKPGNIGVNQWEFKDANGIPVLQELIRIAKEEEDGGFLEYVGTIRPTTGLPAPKIGYARRVNDWQWMVGTGVYVDAINETVAAKQMELMKKISRHVLLIVLVLGGSLFLIFLFSRYVSATIALNINKFSEFFEQSARGVSRINPESVHFTEFRRLADSANMMVEERKKAETALQQVQEQLLRSRKMEALGLLAGGVAHDLNNVLSAMIGYPDLILNTLPPDSPQRKFMETIKESGQKAADIVDDLLTLARRGVAQRMVLDLNALVEHYLSSPEHAQTLEAHENIVVEVQLEPHLLKIKGSQVHLQKSLMNLINNAAEALPSGGTICVCTENRYVDKGFSGYQQIEEGEYVVLKVADDGVGISKQDLEHIFEPFFSKKKLGRSGTGLGMAVVWGTVQDHEGVVNVSTSEGQGTEIELFFRATREDVREEIITSAEQRDYLGNGERILVVDDIHEQRDLSQAILSRLGYETVVVASGEEAVAYLEQNAVDLVVLDMILENPQMDGLETYKRILEVKPGQKAIIASGYAETDRVKEAMSLGAGQYVKKPYTLEKIGLAVKAELVGGVLP